MSVHVHNHHLRPLKPLDSAALINVRDLETSWALDIHEERVGLGHNLLELVGSGLNLSGSV